MSLGKESPALDFLLIRLAYTFYGRLSVRINGVWLKPAEKVHFFRVFGRTNHEAGVQCETRASAPFPFARIILIAGYAQRYKT